MPIEKETIRRLTAERIQGMIATLAANTGEEPSDFVMGVIGSNDPTLADVADACNVYGYRLTLGFAKIEDAPA